MISLHESKLIWLQRFLEVNKGKLTWREAEKIIHKLDYIEMEYWGLRQEADSQTHITESYNFEQEPPDYPDPREFIDY